jgi:transcriptional regulator with XRE-family HTH domain
MKPAPPGARYDNAHCLLDSVILRQRLKNDAELSRRLMLAPSSISKIRRGRNIASDEVLLRIHEVFDISIAELKLLMAMQARMESAG